MDAKFQLEGIKHEVETRWCVFRDSAISKFLLAYFDQRIADLARSIENISPDGLTRIQGEISEARKTREFLARTNMQTALTELINKVK